jgi:hypothetical protein
MLMGPVTKCDDEFRARLPTSRSSLRGWAHCKGADRCVGPHRVKMRPLMRRIGPKYASNRPKADVGSEGGTFESERRPSTEEVIMTDVSNAAKNVQKRVPWTRVRSLALCRHFGRSTFGLSGRSSRLRDEPVIWRCSTSRSTASFVAATWWA